MLLYMVRHGQTDWNAENRFQGQQDIPLNARGRGQATGNGEALARILGSEASDMAYVASPLGRTRETMERLRTAMGLEPLSYDTDVRLKEVCFGDWEGLTISQIEEIYPERIEARARGKWDFIPPGNDAESYEILSWRIGAWLNTVDRPTVCVAHGGVIRAVFRLVADMSKDEACELNIPQDRLLLVDRHSRNVSWV